MDIRKIILESTDEYTVLEFLKNKIRGTKWENKVFLAGGAVRDEIMGKPAKDLDFTIIGNLNAGIDFASWLGRELGNFKQDSNPVIYPKFGTAKLSLNNNNQNLPTIELEFVAPRKEEYRHGSRKPIVVAGTIEDDATRRDLTINSLLKNISTGEILDISGKGIDDIENGIIRTTQNADIIFKEDALRMLRAIRFACKYGFVMETDVIKSIKKNAELINTISSERIRDEMDKMLMTNDPKKAFRLLKVTGLLTHIIGEFDAAINMKQNAHHKDDVFMHSMDVLSKTPPNLKTRLMGLFHDIGKTLTKTVSPEGSVHFYEHEEVGAEMVKKIMARLKYPNDLIDAVVSGVKHHMRLKHGGPDAGDISDKTLRKFVVTVGQNLEDILDLIHADNIAHSEHSSMPKQIEIVRSRLEKLNMQLENNKPKLPINGGDLIKIGFKQGKSIGVAMDAVTDAYYENPNLTYDEAIEIAKKTKMDSQINEMKRIMKYLIK
jgi:poly(A) polymerase